MKRYYILIVLGLCLPYFSFSQVKLEDLRIPYKKEGKWGYSDKDGKIIVPPIYDEVEKAFGSQHFAVTKNKLKGVIDKDGKVLIPLENSYCVETMNNYFIVANQNKKFGILDTKNEVVFPLEYDYIYDIENWGQGGYYIKIAKNGKEGILQFTDDGLEFLVPIEYKYIKYDMLEHTFISTTTSGEKKYISTSGKQYTPYDEGDMDMMDEVVPVPEDDVEPKTTYKTFDYPDGKVGMRVKKKVYDSKKRKMVTISTDTLPGKYTSMKKSHKDFIIVVNEGLYGVISLTGEVLLPVEYVKIEEYTSTVEGGEPYAHRFVVFKNRKYGMVGNEVKNGKIKQFNKVLLPIEYNSIREVGYTSQQKKRNPYLLVEKEGKYGLFSIQTLTLVIEIKYPKLDPRQAYFFDGFIIFQLKDEYGGSVYLGSNGVEYFEK